MNRTDTTPGARLTLWLILAGFVISLAANLPGHLSYDSVVELLEGRTGQYAGWHPPITSWLLGIGDAILPGTALFATADTALIFGCLLALLALKRAGGWLPAFLVVIFAALPQFLIYPGIVWKDVLFGGTSVMAFVVLTHAAAQWAYVRARFVLLAIAFGLFVLGALVRQNGIVMLAGGTVALGWIAWRHEADGWRGALKLAGGALIVSLIVFSLANVALGMRLVNVTGYARQVKLLQMYDIVAIVAADRSTPLTEFDKNDPAFSAAIRSDGAKLYSPQRNDPLAASPSLSNALQAAPPSLVTSQWLDLLVHHPLLYIEQRADMFYWVVFTPQIAKCLPFTVGVEGPKEAMDDLNIDPRSDDRDVRLSTYATSLEGTPVYSHVLFAILSMIAIVLLLLRRSDTDIAVAAMMASYLVFTLTYFFISLACDYRYLYGLDLSAMLGWFYMALDWPGSAFRGLIERHPLSTR
jgi:hypothetical protein